MTGAAQVFVAREHVNDDSVVVLKIHCADGTCVEVDQVVMEIETSKTTVEVTSPHAGILRLTVAEEQEVDIGALLFEVHPESMPAAPALAPAAAPATVNGGHTEAEAGDVLFSKPALRRLEELGIAPGAFAGRRWVTLEDVEAAGRGSAAGRPSPGAGSAAPAAAAPGVRPGEPGAGATMPDIAHHAQRRSKRKRTEVASLTYYGNAVPQSTIGIDIGVPGSRTVSAPPLFRHSITDLVVYEASKLLPAYPELNAFHIDEKTYGVYQEVNFGISFDSGRNLKVLTLAGADTRSLSAIQAGIQDLLEVYEGGAPIPPGLLQASTVTLSDLSQSLAGYMLPLLNGPQSLILGLIRRSRDGFSLYASFDHRIAEGLLVTRFLEELRERVQSYFVDEAGAVNIRCHACSKHISEEVALGNRGFLTMRLASGEDALLCRNCFQGL